jgi:inositol-hexakisphosphate 5-kinase
MAMVASASTTDVRMGMDVGPSPTFADFNLRGFNSSNSSLVNHRQLLSGNARGRGTSLERTEKERRVQEVTKGTYSTNPGDTGIPGAPVSPTPSESITRNPPTEGVRAEYRSWRDARRPVMAAEKAWSISNQGSEDSQDGQVEKSVKKVLAGVEHNNRSRKASHSLGFFKEGLPEDKIKKRDNKSRGRSQDGPSRAKDLVGRENEKQKGGKSTYTPHTEDSQSSRYSTGRSPLEGPSERASKHKPDLTQSPTREAIPRGFDGASHSIAQSMDVGVEEPARALPAQLLDEIRKHHNLTPGAAKGSSFSSSIPVTESERSKPDGDDEFSNLPRTIREEANDDGAELSHVRSADDEDDSGEEQISSALFVPHQTPHESPERTRHGSDSDDGIRLKDENRMDITDSQQWLEEHEVPTDKVNMKYVMQENKTRPLPSPTHITQKDFTDNKSPSLHDVPEIEHDSQDEGGYSTMGEESGVDDPDTTPTGSLKTAYGPPSAYQPHIHDHQQKTKQPLAAMELIPYRHQVGGHTTMWRFSKRAVCKQLNNRENEFYERIERNHPQLLSFLPRCV